MAVSGKGAEGLDTAARAMAAELAEWTRAEGEEAERQPPPVICPVDATAPTTAR